MRHSAGLTIIAMASLLAMASCSPSRESLRARPVFSPNGEMLSPGGRYDSSCPQSLGDWWDRLAASHGGTITKQTFLADAEAEFAAMDLDHDGFITPSELTEYRASMAPAEDPALDNVPPPGADGRTPSTDSDSNRAGRGNRRTGAGGGATDAGYRSPRYGQIPADVVDPVMSADKSLSFKVSHEDFMAQAHDLFADIDKNHDGEISRAELIATCPEKK